MDVAILGCGPAALLAAHACQINQCHFAIFSKKRKSQLFGSQYLHEPISGVTRLPERVSYTLNGTPEEYRRKVYGDNWDGAVSPEDLEEDHWAWDIRDAYENLWSRYSNRIVPAVFKNYALTIRDYRLNSYDLVISTVPRNIWRQTGDQFVSTKIWAIGDAPELGVTVPFHLAQDNTIICDGTKDVGWYRLSKVFGHSTIEWPGGAKPPVSDVTQVIKPLECKAASQPDNWLFVGRYGKWEKGVLTTDAFNDVLKATA